jgi:integrase
MLHRARKPYLVFPKPSKKFRQLFYVQFRLPDGSLSVPRASGQTSSAGAETWAVEQIRAGVIEQTLTSRNRREELISFLTDFWDFERSRYIRGRLARGNTIGRAYCQCMALMVGKYVKPHFEGRRISSLTADDFDEWMAQLSDDGAAPRPINLARQSVNTALNYLVGLRRLPWNPLSSVKPYHEKHSKRGTVTADEYRALLALEGLDPRVYAAIGLSGLCGMRLGEIRGLK